MNLNERIIELKNANERKKISGSCKALFLDRDGVLIKDVGYISRAEDVILESGIKKLLAFAYVLNIPVFIITNQSGISRGYYDWDDFEEVNLKMLELIGEPSPIVAIYANSHLKDLKSNWRKPNPDMIFSAAKKFNINIGKSILIGDRVSDMIAGCRSGIDTLIHVRTGHGQKEYSVVLNYCDGDVFVYGSNKSRIIFIDNLLQFPYEKLKG